MSDLTEESKTLGRTNDQGIDTKNLTSAEKSEIEEAKRKYNI